MVDLKKLGKLRITKTSYSFDVNKAYGYEKKFAVIEKNPLQMFIEGFTKKKKEEPSYARKKTAPEKTGINPLLIGGVIGLLLIIVIGAWAYLALQNVPPDIPVTEIESTMNVLVKSGGVITYGEKYDGLHNAKITIEQKIEEYDDITLTLKTYVEEPPYQIYILNEPRDESQTTIYDDFKSTLLELLKNKGIMVNSINLNEMKTISKGALVIVPSARIPSKMIESGENNIMELLERGVHILYIGKEFKNTVNENGEVVIADSEDLEKLGISFKSAGSSSELKYLFQPQYIASGDSEYYINSVQYGVVSIIKHAEGGGYLIMVPQTLDAGWSHDSLKAAEDIETIILETKWMTASSEKIYELESNNETIIKTYFTEPFADNTIYVRMDFKGTKNNKEFGKRLYFNAKKQVAGELYITDGTALLSTSISGNSIRIKADLKEKTGKTVYPYVSIIGNGVEIKKEPLSDLRISTQTESDFDVLMDINEGEHTAQILDEYGNVYAEGYVNSVPIDIQLISTDDDVFEYTFKVEGNSVVLKEIDVVIDSGKLGEYHFEDASYVKIDLKPILGFGGKLETGEHTFEFTIGDLKKEEIYGVTVQETIFTSPLFFGTIIFVFGILGVGSYLAAQKKPLYSIDIPDFPPTEFAKIKVPKELIIHVFNIENEYHKWKNTPLTLSEIKNGLKKTFYKGKHLNTSDFNITYILDKMKKNGLIKEELGYYMPSVWEDNGTIRYLAMFRRLRDIFVVNAIPFTKKGEAEECDSKVTVIGQEMFIYIYDEKRINEIIGKLIQNANSGINIVITGNKYENNQFNEILTSPTPAASIVKFETEGKTISVMDADEFEKMIKEMKG